jgi:predicted HicB family RNase H-like nuclease
MAISQAQQRATAKYIRNNYDRLEMKVQKGQKELIVAHAKEQGETLNQFLIRAVNLALKQDNYTGEEIIGTASSKAKD